MNISGPQPTIWPLYVLCLCVGILSFLVWLVFIPGCRLIEVKLPELPFPQSPVPDPSTTSGASKTTPDWITTLGSTLGMTLAIIGHRYWYHRKGR